MKKIVTILVLFTTLASGYYFFSLDETKEGNAEQVFTKKYEQWLLDRYKDPLTGEIPQNIRQRELKFARELNAKNKKLNNKYNAIQSLNEWTSRGPYYMGGRTRALALDINDENRILAGGVDAGVLLSTDGGLTWSKKTKNTQLPSITTIDQDKRPGKQNIWYHGTGERLGSRALGNGVYKSTDNGESWFQLKSTINGSIGAFDNAFDFVYRVRTNPKAPSDKDEVYAATSLGGIFRSEDGGYSWDAVLGGGVSNNLSNYTDIEVTTNGVFYASMSSHGSRDTSFVKGIFRSTDGENWVNITPTEFPARYNRIAIGIDPQNESKVYFVGETPGYGTLTTNSRQDSLWHSLYKYEYISNDGKGENGKWTDLSQNIPNPELVRHQMNSQGGYDLHIKVHPTDSNVVYIGAVNLYRSKSAWQENDFEVIGGTCPTNDCDYFYRYPNHHADQHNLVFLPSNPNIMFTATDGGIHKTLDNRGSDTEWISLNEDYNTTQLYSVAIDHATESADLIGGFQDNGTNYSVSYDTKSTWSEVLRADGFNCAIADSSKFIITSQNSSQEPDIKFYKSELDANGKMVKYARIDPIGGKDFIWNTPFILDPNDNNILYIAGGRTVWRNNDLSKVEMKDFPTAGWRDFKILDSITTEWNELTNTNVIENDTNERITAIQVSKSPANILYYGTNRGNLYRLDNSNTGDPTPVKINSDEFNTNSNVTSISIDPEDATKVVVAFSNYNVRSIFYSTNSGSNWEQVGGNLESNDFGTGTSPAINIVKIIEYNGKMAFLAGTSIGLYLTAELNGMGTVWQQEAENTIGYNNVFTLDSRSTDGYTVVGTYATGTYGTYFNNFPLTPEKVTLNFPHNNSTFVQEDIRFNWEQVTGAYYYKIEIATDSKFENIVFQKNDIDTNNVITNVIEKGLNTYYWRVAPINAGGVGVYSDSWLFQTGLGTPKMIYPEQSSTNIPTSVNLKWEKFDIEGITYKIQLSSNGFFTNILFEEETNEDNINFQLEGGKKYFWRVMAFNEIDSSGYNEKYNFTTEPLSSVEIIGFENKISLYPNPSSNKLNIYLNELPDLPKSIKIYNQSGKFIQSIDLFGLINKIKPIDISNYINGKYFIKFEFDKFTISKSFIKI